MKKVLALALAVCLILSLGVLAHAEGPYKVGYSALSLGNSFFVQQQEEFIAAAEEYKEAGLIDEYVTTNANGDTAKQISDIEDLITKGCDIIILDASSPTALIPVVEEAFEAGVKISSVVNTVDTDLQTVRVYSDEFEFGRIGAQFIADSLNGEGKIVILNAVAGLYVNEQRRAGAESVFSQYPGIEIIAEANGDCDYAKGKSVMESFVSAYDEIDGVWSQGGAMTQAAVDVFNSVGRQLVPMSGEGGNGFLRVWKENSDKGFTSIAPCISSAAPRIALEACLKALPGETIETEIIMPTEFITEETIDEYYRPDLSDNYWCGNMLSNEVLTELYGD